MNFLHFSFLVVQTIYFLSARKHCKYNGKQKIAWAADIDNETNYSREIFMFTSESENYAAV